MSILTFIRDGAVQTAVHGTDVREREDARNLARAIDHLATEMRSRLDTALLQNQRETDGRRFE
jgi:restriction endonuclease Mrr